MQKLLISITLCSLLTACVNTTCPSCEPPVKHFDVVTECTDYTTTELGMNRYSQCRYCVDKIYSNGVDVTAQFMNTQQTPKKLHKKSRCHK